MTHVHTVIYAKAPLAGYAKTRLIPALGAEGAARVADKLLRHAIAQAIAADIGTVEVCGTPSWADAAWQTLPALPAGVERTDQAAGDLGARLTETSRRIIDKGSSLLLMGADCPALDATRLRLAAAALSEADCCLQPVADGGYALLGLNHHHPSLFDSIPWSTDRVAAITRERIGALNWTLQEFPALHDVDEPEDLVWLPEGWVEQVVNVKEG